MCKFRGMRRAIAHFRQKSMWRVKKMARKGKAPTGALILFLWDSFTLLCRDWALFFRAWLWRHWLILTNHFSFARMFTFKQFWSKLALLLEASERSEINWVQAIYLCKWCLYFYMKTQSQIFKTSITFVLTANWKQTTTTSPSRSSQA